MGRLAARRSLYRRQQRDGLAQREFDREGARVAMCGLNEGTLQATRETLRAGISPFARTSAISPTWTRCSPRSSGVRAPGRRLLNAGYSEFWPLEDVTEQASTR